MGFDEFISSVGYGCDADIVLARKAWDAAIEAAALLVEANFDECEPWITPEKVLELSSNGLMSRPATKD